MFDCGVIYGRLPPVSSALAPYSTHFRFCVLSIVVEPSDFSAWLLIVLGFTLGVPSNLRGFKSARI